MKPLANKFDAQERFHAAMASSDDTTAQIRALIKQFGGAPHIAALLGTTPATVHAWAAKGTIPPTKILPLATATLVPVHLMLPLASSERRKKAKVLSILTLTRLIEVRDGLKTPEDCAKEFGISVNQVVGMIEKSPNSLELTRDTLVKYRDRVIKRGEAARILSMDGRNFAKLAAKFGVKPVEKASLAVEKTDERLKDALKVIAGDAVLKDLPGWRTVSRRIQDAIAPLNVNNLKHWPNSWRRALVREVEGRSVGVIAHLMQFGMTHKLKLWVRERETPQIVNYREAEWVDLAIIVLLGLETVESVAAKRGGEPLVVRNLIGAEIQMFEWQEIDEMTLEHKAAIAEALLALKAAQGRPKGLRDKVNMERYEKMGASAWLG